MNDRSFYEEFEYKNLILIQASTRKVDYRVERVQMKLIVRFNTMQCPMTSAEGMHSQSKQYGVIMKLAFARALDGISFGVLQIIKRYISKFSP